VVFDALSRKYEEGESLFSLSFIIEDWLKAVFQEWFQDPNLSFMIHQLQQYPQTYLDTLGTMMSFTIKVTCI
jgi:hypothetical protein